MTINHLAHFGLNEEPFRLTPDRDFYFASANQTAIGEVIRFGLDQGEGFIIVTGEVGTGKTMLLRYLTVELAQKYDTALLLSPHFSPLELVRAILRDLEVIKPEDQAQSLDDLLRILNEYLYDLSRENRRLLVIIDEAQNLPDKSIEQLRLLSNFESDKQKLLQILLVGQPELKEKILAPGLRQLLQRVTIMETLLPLSKEEMGLYIHFRLKRAGSDQLRLTRDALRLLWRKTFGIPRLINKIMSRALLVAYSQQKKTIDAQVMRKTVAMFAPGQRIARRAPHLLWGWKLLLFLVLLGLAGLLSYLGLQPANNDNFWALWLNR